MFEVLWGRLRWRRAGGEGMVPRLVWTLAAIGFTGATVAGIWVAYANGGHQQAVAADDMANKLWSQHTPGYVVTVSDGVGTVTQTGISGMTVNLTASSQQAFTGQNVTLTATASEDVNGYELAIFDQTTGQWVGQSVTSGTENTATVTHNAAGSHTYVAYVGRPDNSINTAVSSQPVTVTWAAVSISVQATPSTNVLPGQHVTITGQVTSDGMGVSGQTVTLSVNRGSLSASQVTTDQNGNFTAIFTPNTSGTYTITASCDGQTTTTTVQVRPSFTVTLQASNTMPLTGQSVTLTATVNQDVAPYSLSILEQTTGQVVAGPITSGSSLSASVTQTAPGSHSYVAVVSGVAQSSPVTVSWAQPVVTINAPSTINEGQTVTIWGTVKSTTGAPMANQRVNVSASTGTLNGGGLTATVTTDSNGQWSVSYTAPNSVTGVTFTATSGSSQATAYSTVQWSPPTVQQNLYSVHLMFPGEYYSYSCDANGNCTWVWTCYPAAIVSPLNYSNTEVTYTTIYDETTGTTMASGGGYSDGYSVSGWSLNNATQTGHWFIAVVYDQHGNVVGESAPVQWNGFPSY